MSSLQEAQSAPKKGTHGHYSTTSMANQVSSLAAMFLVEAEVRRGDQA